MRDVALTTHSSRAVGYEILLNVSIFLHKENHPVEIFFHLMDVIHSRYSDRFSTELFFCRVVKASAHSFKRLLHGF